MRRIRITEGAALAAVHDCYGNQFEVGKGNVIGISVRYQKTGPEYAAFASVIASDGVQFLINLKYAVFVMFAGGEE